MPLFSKKTETASVPTLTVQAVDPSPQARSPEEVYTSRFAKSSKKEAYIDALGSGGHNGSRVYIISTPHTHPQMILSTKSLTHWLEQMPTTRRTAAQ